LNGWATSDSPWSNAGAALDPEDDDEIPAWRRPSAEVRPFTRQPAPPPEGGPPWSTGRARYSDLLAHLSPNGSGSLQPGPVPTGPDYSPTPEPYAMPRRDRPDTLQADDQRRTSEMRAIDAPPPSSAPPYPYEGDLDDDRRPPQAAQQRASVPLSRPFPAVRPATPGGRRVDWNTADSARHALEPPTPAEGMPPVDAPADAAQPGQARSSYDPSSFPRRLPYEPPAAVPHDATTSGYASPTAYSGPPGRSAGDPGPGPSDLTPRALPQRVPAEPDVPKVPEPPSVEPPAETPALARIATHLRRGDLLPAQERQEGFDVNAILAAVKEVDGVRDASLRATPAGAHSLRLDLAEGADPAEVSRQVARLLQDRMGLDAAMQANTAEVPTRPQPQPSSSPPFTQTQAPAPPPSGQTPAPPPFGQTPAPPQARPIPSGRVPVSGGPIGRASVTESAVETLPSAIDCGPPRPLEVGEHPGPRAVIENVQVNTFGTEATVEVRLSAGGRIAAGIASGPAIDGYLLRLCATATTAALDDLLSGTDHVDGPARFFVEHAGSVPFGSMQVAVVVLLLSCGGWVEQLAGSAVVTGDDRHAMVRATLAAVNRRLEALLS
jgi:hypothetical protein